MRTAYEALAAALGGTQSLHTNSFDEAMALPTEFSARIARNTQLILQHETGITHVADPLAGSYYVESLTAELAEKAWALIGEVDALGGMTRAVASGMPKLRIEESAARRQAAVDRGEEVIVGVNRYRLAKEDHLDIRDVDNVGVRDAQVARLARIRATRDAAACEAALAALEQAATSGGNLLAAAVEAARARATVGEISDAMERAFGRHRAEVQDAGRRLWRGLRGRRRLRRDPGGRGALRRGGGASAAHAGGQDGPGRPRPRGEGDRHGLRRHRLRRGRRAAVPDARRRRRRTRSTTTCTWSASRRQAAGHKTLAPKLVEALKAQGAGDILVICGGVIPQQDYGFLKDAGVSAIFGPGTNIPEAAQEILGLIRTNRAERAKL